MGFSARGGSGMRTEGLRDGRGTINISGSLFFFLLVMAGLLCLFVCMDHKMMNCRFSSHTYCTVLLFQTNKTSLRTWTLAAHIKATDDCRNGQI